MWESTVVESKQAQPRRWGRVLWILSICLHVVFGAVFFIASLFGPFPVRTPSMMESYRLAMVPPMPPPPPPKRPQVPVNAVKAPQQNVAPTVIPDEIPDLTNVPPPVEVPEVVNPIVSYEDGDVGGTEGGTPGGVVTEEPAPVRHAGDPLIVPRDAPLPLVAMSMTYPQYPEQARIKGIEGDVLVRYRIGKNGRVLEVEVLHAADKILTEAAVRAIKYWRFRPKLENGQPIEVVHELTVRFVLQAQG
jgi:protein TonB